jgi:methylated-DNA-[protein]-cysteine S-methyltransferase
MIETASMRSPIGDVTIAVRDGALVALTFGDDWSRVEALLRARAGDEQTRAARDPGGIASIVRAYFDGDVRALDRVPVQTFGTPMQRRVWDALRKIPAGKTAPYTFLAHAAGAPRAVRAAGSACGKNLIAVAIPCHRAVRTDGSLGGYAGGLDRKEWLLAHERAR